MATTLHDRELLERLVAFDTSTGNSTIPFVDFVAAYLDRPGIRVTVHPSPDGRQASLVAVTGPEVDPGTRRGLTLCGHADVVPVDTTQWQSNPFRLTGSGGRLTGRGTCDMKGFLAVAINAMRRAGTTDLDHPLALLITYDEECNTRGARAFVDTWPSDRPLPRDVLVGEPTELEVVHMHKGMVTLTLRVEGVSAHSGYPALGRSAVVPAARAITALSEWSATLQSERGPHAEAFGEVPYAVLNIGTIAGGRAVNVIPDRCTMGLALRVLPDMDRDGLVTRLRDVVADALRDVPHACDVESESPAMATDPDDPFVRDLLSACGHARPRAVSYSTDAGWLQTAGFRCAIFGPGSIAVAHTPNEYLPEEQFETAATMLDRIVARRCGST